MDTGIQLDAPQALPPSPDAKDLHRLYEGQDVWATDGNTEHAAKVVSVPNGCEEESGPWIEIRWESYGRGRERVQARRVRPMMSEDESNFATDGVARATKSEENGETAPAPAPAPRRSRRTRRPTSRFDGALEQTRFEGMKMAVLRTVLGDRGLKIQGTKPELVSRLVRDDLRKRGDVDVEAPTPADEKIGKRRGRRRASKATRDVGAASAGRVGKKEEEGNANVRQAGEGPANKRDGGTRVATEGGSTTGGLVYKEKTSKHLRKLLTERGLPKYWGKKKAFLIERLEADDLRREGGAAGSAGPLVLSSDESSANDPRREGRAVSSAAPVLIIILSSDESSPDAEEMPANRTDNNISDNDENEGAGAEDAVTATPVRNLSGVEPDVDPGPRCHRNSAGGDISAEKDDAFAFALTPGTVRYPSDDDDEEDDGDDEGDEIRVPFYGRIRAPLYSTEDRFVEDQCRSGRDDDSDWDDDDEEEQDCRGRVVSSAERRICAASKECDDWQPTKVARFLSPAAGETTVSRVQFTNPREGLRDAAGRESYESIISKSTLFVPTPASSARDSVRSGVAAAK